MSVAHSLNLLIAVYVSNRRSEKGLIVGELWTLPSFSLSLWLWAGTLVLYLSFSPFTYLALVSHHFCVPARGLEGKNNSVMPMSAQLCSSAYLWVGVAALGRVCLTCNAVFVSRWMGVWTFHQLWNPFCPRLYSLYKEQSNVILLPIHESIVPILDVLKKRRSKLRF